MKNDTTDTSIDFVYSAEADVVGLATLCIWAYLIPHFYIEYAEYKLALINCPTWGNSPIHLKDAKRALNRSFYLHMSLGFLLYAGTSIMIQTLTWEMDRRASDIVTGFSRLFGGWMFFLLSINLPQWMGSYFSIVDTYKRKLALMRTTREVRFIFSWTLWKYLASLFFFNLYFSCRTNKLTSVYGFLSGLVIGIFLLVITYVARVPFAKRKRSIAGMMGFSLSVVSLVCVWAGCFYINDVWHEDYSQQAYVYGRINFTGLITGLWGGFLLVAHMFVLHITIKREKDGTYRDRYNSQIFNGMIPGLKRLGKKKESKINNGQQNCDDDIVVANLEHRDSKVHQMGDDDNLQEEAPPSTEILGDPYNGYEDVSEWNKDVEGIEGHEDGDEGRVVVGESAMDGHQNCDDDLTVSDLKHRGSKVHQMEDGDNLQETQPASAVPDHLIDDLDNVPEDVDGKNEGVDDNEIQYDGDEGRGVERESVVVTLKQGTPGDFLLSSSEGYSFWYLFRSSLYDTFGCCCGYCGCCFKDIKKNNNFNNTRRYSIDQMKHDNVWWRAFDGLKLFIWYCISMFFLFLTIVNCGATQQQNVVRANLNLAFTLLYPDNYQSGPMCGWNQPNEDGEIRNFESLQELYAANFTLIHCGYCGECSNWNDLSKQWTTRTFLAEVTKKCAQKSLFGGSREDVLQCNKEEPVGFTHRCADCWTTDELCAKKNCFWIFLQSTFTNAVSDYRVELTDITSATCDEAICGPEFVPCSGATRRRMNIESDIERPLYQQCTPQDADWSVVFKHP